MYICLNLVASLAIISSIFLPETSKKILKQINFNTKKIKCNDASDLLIKKQHNINHSERLFEILDVEKIKKLKEKVSIPTDIKDLF